MISITNNNTEEIRINDKIISTNQPVYFIADIAANHDGDLERAKHLIKLAKEAGADAVKFQHHNVKKYVSDFGFKQLSSKQSHQKQWQKTVYEVYKDAEVPDDWTPILKKEADKLDIAFFSTPYDLDMIDKLNPYMPAFKIGSGDLNWDDMLIKIAKTNKPVIIATGACTTGEVVTAINTLKKHTNKIILLQCNTNYTADINNFNYINLNVLKTYSVLFPEITIGLSDHTHGHITVLGAVALGSKVIEKHFTDDNNRNGPDHPFSMNPITWRKMVAETRLLEKALGTSIKKVEENEKETVVLQRRAIRAIRDITIGETLTREMIEFQRPAPIDSFYPNDFSKIKNKKISLSIKNGDYLRSEHIVWDS